MLVHYQQFQLIQRSHGFALVPIGKNSLNKMLKDMCHEAGITGRKTNHNLRATGASELFAAGVPEKIIKEQTGHRSLDALHVYEHTTSTLHQNLISRGCITPSIPSSSSSSSASNIFNICSVQVIQATHPVQLPPLPPPLSSSTPTQRAPEALDVCTTNFKTDIDIQQ